MATATNTSTAPNAMVPSLMTVPPGPYMPPAISRPPRIATTTASAGMNRAKRDGGSTAPSCSAAIGGTRVARVAGITAESTVTTMPTARAMTTVRGCSTRPLRGMSKPAAWNTWLTPAATPSPAKSPITEARTPMTSASPVMLQSTCARDAPSARSIANSAAAARRSWRTR